MIEPHLEFRAKQPVPPPHQLIADIWHTTYCGVPAVQAWQDFMLWERFLNDTKPTSLMEIGTFEGGFSLYLQHQCYGREMTFYTVDWQEFAKFNDPHGALSLNGTKSMFHHLDVWTPQFDSLLNSIIASEDRLVLFCDGGNKPREMQTFVPRLRVGDLAVTHDWGNEITDQDLVGLPVEKVLQAECEELNSLTRFFRRV